MAHAQSESIAQAVKFCIIHVSLLYSKLQRYSFLAESLHIYNKKTPRMLCEAQPGFAELRFWRRTVGDTPKCRRTYLPKNDMFGKPSSKAITAIFSA